MTARIVIDHAQRRPTYDGRPRLAAANAAQRLLDRSAQYDDPRTVARARRVRAAVASGDPLASDVLAIMAMPGAAAWLDALNRMAARDRTSTGPILAPVARPQPGRIRPRDPLQVSAGLRVPAPWERGGRP
jgi:hypothetical protein